jgi:hypothetical protein
MRVAPAEGGSSPSRHALSGCRVTPRATVLFRASANSAARCRVLPGLAETASTPLYGAAAALSRCFRALPRPAGSRCQIAVASCRALPGVRAKPPRPSCLALPNSGALCRALPGYTAKRRKPGGRAWRTVRSSARGTGQAACEDVCRLGTADANGDRRRRTLLRAELSGLRNCSPAGVSAGVQTPRQRGKSWRSGSKKPTDSPRQNSSFGWAILVSLDTFLSAP